MTESNEEMSETIAELAKALSKAQGVLDHAKKDVANDFYKSKYATLANVLDAAKAPLADNGLAVTQTTKLDAEGSIILTTTLLHSSGEWIKSWYPVDPVKRDPQGYGSALSYARRYSFSALIGVASADDDGEGAMGRGKGHSQDVDRKPSLPPTKPLPAASFKNVTPPDEGKAREPMNHPQASTTSPATASPKPATTQAMTVGAQGWKDVICHLGNKGGPVNGKRLGDISGKAQFITFITEKLAAIKSPSQQDNLLKAALAMREAEMAPSSPQPELGSSRVNLDALRAKAIEAKVPLDVILKVARNVGADAVGFSDIDEETAGHMVSNWKDTLAGVAFETDSLPA